MRNIWLRSTFTFFSLLFTLYFLNPSSLFAQLSGTYTVGSGGDYATLNDAVSALNNQGVSSAVTFDIISGVYNEQVSINAVSGVSASNTITFQSQTTDSADVEINYSASGSGDNYIVKLSGTDYITFQHLTFRAQGTSYARIFYLESGIENLNINNCSIIGYTTTSSSTNFSLIFGENSAVSQATLTNNTFYYGSTSIQVRGTNNSTLSSGIIVSDNTIIQAGYRGLLLEYLNAPLISGNTIDADDYGIFASRLQNGFKIENNKVTVRQSGYCLYVVNTESDNTPSVISNNMLIATSGSSPYALYSNANSTLDIFHNSVLVTNGGNSSYAFYQTGNGSDIDIVNNNFVNNGSGRACFVNTPSAIDQMDYNNLYTRSGVYLANWNGQNLYNLDSLKSVSGKNANSLSVPPFYAAADDLHAASPWLDNTGTALPSVTSDFDGEARDASNPSIGADEFTADAAVSTPLAGTYTIGSSGDYAGFSEAADALMLRGISSTVTFNVLADTYNEQFEIETIPGISGADSVVFQSQSGNATDVTMEFTSDAGNNNYLVQLHGSDRVTFKNLTFQANGSSYSRIFDIIGEVEDFNLFNNILNGLNTTSSSQNYSLIQSTSSFWKKRTVVGNEFNFGSYAIHLASFSSNTDVSGTLIQDNTINSAGYYGIYLNYMDSPVIEENMIDARIYGLFISNSENAIAVIANDIDVSGSGYGIYLAGSAGGNDRGLIANNFVRLTSSSSPYALYLNNSSNVDIYHNSVLVQNGATNSRAFYITGNVSNINVANNIFSNNGGGYAAYANDASSFNTFDYNNFYTKSGVYLAHLDGNNYFNLDSLQNDSGTNANSVSVPSFFTSASDLHPRSPWLDDTGTPLAAVSVDIDGELRDTNSPSIGADEFTADAGLSTPLAGSYTIGTSGDYQNFNEAVDELLLRGVSAPVTFDVQNATYNEQVELLSIPGSGIADTVIFQAQSGDASDVTLEYVSSTADDNYIIKLLGTDHVTFRNLTFEANGTSYARIFDIVGETEHIRLHGNVLNGLSTNSSSGNYSLIYSNNAYWTHRNIRMNTLNNGSYAVDFRGYNSNIYARGTMVQDNTINSTGYYGIFGQYLDRPMITSNIINSRIYGLYLNSCGNDLHITGNQITVTGSGYGMYVNNTNAGNEGALVANNSLIMTSTSSPYGIYTTGNSNFNFYHNSVLITSGSTNSRAFASASNNANLNVINNIFANNGSGYATHVADPSDYDSFDYNNLYTRDGVYISNWDGINFFNLDSLRDLSGKDMNSLSVPAFFVSDNDLHGTSPWLDDAGTPLGDVTTDIDGEIRDMSTPSIGADEYTADAAVTTPLAGTYTIGQTGNYVSLTEAVNDLLIRGISAPVTFNIESGSYNEQVELYSIPGSSPSDTVVFQSQTENAGDVVIDYVSSSADDNYIVKLRGTDFILFKNITFDANGTSYARNFEFIGETDHIRLQANIFKGYDTNSSSSNFALVFSSAAYWNRQFITDNTFTDGSYAVYARNFSSQVLSGTTTFKSNTINGAGYYGLYLQYYNSPLVYGNSIESRVYGIFASIINNAMRIEKNKIKVSSSGYGIYLSNSEGNNDRLKIINNFIAMTGTGSPYGIYSDRNNNLDIYHNNVHISQGGTNSRAFISNGTGTDNTIMNNIFANNGSGYAVYVNNPSAINTSDYNSLFSQGTNLGHWDGTDYTDLAGYQSASSKEANSVSINPGYYSENDLHVTTAALDNLGMVLADVTEDIDGQLRDGSTPDIGADEFNGSNNAPTLINPIADYSFDENSGPQTVASDLNTVFNDQDEGDSLKFEVTSDNPRIIPAVDGDSLTVSASANYSGEGNIIVYGIDQWGLSATDTVLITVREVTGIDDAISNAIPEDFIIDQNYPNPFNPVTTIRYGLPQSADVRIEIYNVVGQRVAVLTDTRKQAGYHTVIFDASGYSSGTYFYRISSDGFQAIRRMVLVK